MTHRMGQTVGQADTPHRFYNGEKTGDVSLGLSLMTKKTASQL